MGKPSKQDTKKIYHRERGGRINLQVEAGVKITGRVKILKKSPKKKQIENKRSAWGGGEAKRVASTMDDPTGGHQKKSVGAWKRLGGLQR